MWADVSQATRFEQSNTQSDIKQDHRFIMNGMLVQVFPSKSHAAFLLTMFYIKQHDAHPNNLSSSRRIYHDHSFPSCLLFAGCLGVFGCLVDFVSLFNWFYDNPGIQSLSGCRMTGLLPRNDWGEIWQAETTILSSFCKYRSKPTLAASSISTCRMQVPHSVNACSYLRLTASWDPQFPKLVKRESDW